MKVALLSPLPPTRSGVAHYASMLLPALAERVELTAFGSLEGYRRDDFDAAIYQLGNNPHHEFAYAEAMERPGVAVLHDVVLHHLIVEMTLARGDVRGYVASLRSSHGEAGAAWAQGRAAGLHSEMGNFLLPASVEVARRSRAVIAHNRWAADRLQSLGVDTPIHIVPHPYQADASRHDREFVRTSIGIKPGERVIGLFGFLTSAKRGEVVVEAFRRARERDPNLRLLVVGEPAPNIDVAQLGGEGVIITGYVRDENFASYYDAADRLVNLRYPSAGETSGTLIRAFAAGKPVAVSDYAQFAEYPGECVVKVPFGEREVEALVAFFLGDLNTKAIAASQKAWLEVNARLDLTVDGYLAALQTPARATTSHRATAGSLPLFPRIALAGVAFEEGAALLTLRNDGEAVIRARVYGEPGYRLLVKLYDDAGEVADHWLQLPGDLGPGASADIRIPLPDGALTLRMYHALEGIPVIDPAPAAEVSVARV